MANDSLFHPYTITMQYPGCLELQMNATRRKTTLWILRVAPLIPLLIGLVLFLVNKELFFLLIFGGVTLIEVIILLFVQSPVAIKADTIGLTVSTISVKGEKEAYYLWNDVDRLRYRTIRAKNNTILAYDAILKTGKKVRLLSFPNYHAKKESIRQMNEALGQVSHKAVTDR